MLISNLIQSLCWLVCLLGIGVQTSAGMLALPASPGSSQCAMKVIGQKEIAQQEPSANEPATTTTEKYDIPLLYDRLRTPCPIVQVSINGQPPLPFKLDTGTNQVIAFTPQGAKTLKLHPTQERCLVNGKVKVPIVHIDTISLPTVNNPHHKPFSILNVKLAEAVIINIPAMPGETPFAGVVGLNMCSQATVKLNFATKMMTLYVNATPPELLASATKLPMKKTTSWQYSVTLQADGQHAYDFLLDTGCTVTQILKEAVRPFDVHETILDVQHPLIGGLENHLMGLLPALHLGELISENLAVTYPIEEKKEKTKNHVILYPGDEKANGRSIIGMNLLCRYIVIFDFPNHQLCLQPAANYTEMARLMPFSGVRVVSRGAKAQIAEVLPGSAADRAGLQKSDLVLEVDGQPMQGLSTLQLQQFVDGWGETEASLQVQRQGEIKEIRYHRYSIAVVSWTVDVGLELHFISPARMLVDNSEKAFPAYLAGIRKGDEILAVGDQSVETTDYERLLQAICNPPTNPLVLTIQRKGEAQPRQVMVKW